MNLLQPVNPWLGNEWQVRAARPCCAWHDRTAWETGSHTCATVDPPPPSPIPSQIYNEYYQWSPSHNQNSASHHVNAGDLLFGSITYIPATNSYDIYHNSSDGW